MGQHKHNPTAIAAAKGELPPKPKQMGKRERERLMYAECQRILCRSFYNNVVLPQFLGRRTDDGK